MDWEETSGSSKILYWWMVVNVREVRVVKTRLDTSGGEGVVDLWFIVEVDWDVEVGGMIIVQPNVEGCGKQISTGILEVGADFEGGGKSALSFCASTLMFASTLDVLIGTSMKCSFSLWDSEQIPLSGDLGSDEV